MEIYSLDAGGMERQGDTVKDLVLHALYVDGLLTGEQIVGWSKTHVVLLKKPLLISRWYKKLLDKEEMGAFRMMIGTIAEIKSGTEEQGE